MLDTRQFPHPPCLHSHRPPQISELGGWQSAHILRQDPSTTPAVFIHGSCSRDKQTQFTCFWGFSGLTFYLEGLCFVLKWYWDLMLGIPPGLEPWQDANNVIFLEWMGVAFNHWDSYLAQRLPNSLYWLKKKVTIGCGCKKGRVWWQQAWSKEGAYSCQCLAALATSSSSIMCCQLAHTQKVLPPCTALNLRAPSRILPSHWDRQLERGRGAACWPLHSPLCIKVFCSAFEF